MFSKTIIDSDWFMDMPHSSQMLYFHMAMRADDDGFVSSPKKIMRMIGAQDDDYKILLGKRFIIPFENGVCVIKHWWIHNTLRKDRYIETTHTKEKAKISVKSNKAYTSLGSGNQKEGNGCPSIEENSIDIEEKSNTPSQIAKEFFNDYEVRFSYILKLKEQGYDLSIIKREIEKFVDYWIEKNKSGTKERWELEKTFEVYRRIKKWFDLAKIEKIAKPETTKMPTISDEQRAKNVERLKDMKKELKIG